MGRTVFIIDYWAEGRSVASDCYPDFCYSRAEAEAIALEFMNELDWAVRWTIREEELGS
jgi:hypothetical protein